MTRIIGVDTGNRMIKTAGGRPFTAGVVNNGPIRPPVQKDVLFYKGNYYTLSDTRNTYHYDKTVDEDYLTLTLIAIAKELRRADPKATSYDERIILAMGLPLMHASVLGNKYKEFFAGNGKAFEYIFDDIEYRVHVDEVMIYPQGLAAVGLPEYSSKIKKRALAYAIDIGGYTTDVARFEFGKPQTTFCRSFESGVIHMYNQIQRRVAGEFQTEIPDVMIDAILAGDEDPEPDITRVVKEEADKYAVELLNLLRDNGVNLRMGVPVFIGGGAVRMKDALIRNLNKDDYVMIDEVRANAKGYEYLTQINLEKRRRMSESVVKAKSDEVPAESAAAGTEKSVA